MKSDSLHINRELLGNQGGSGQSRIPTAAKNRRRRNRPRSVRDMFGATGPPSYHLWAPKETVGASCNLIDISPSYRKFVDREPLTFSSRIDLCRSEGNFYKICITPKGEGPKRRSLGKLVSVVATKGKNCMRAVFGRRKNETKDFFVIVQFRHKLQYIHFVKIMKEVVRQNDPKYESPVETRGEYIPRVLYSPRVSVTNALTKDISGAVLSPARKIEHQLYRVMAENWMPPQVKSWVEHIFVEESPRKPIMTLFKYMESLSKEHYRNFIDYFTHDVDEKNSRPKKSKKSRKRKIARNYMTLGKEIDAFEEDPGKCNQILRDFLSSRVIRDALKTEIKKLVHSHHGTFDIHYYLVLRKRVKLVKRLVDSKKLNAVHLNLRNISHQLLDSRRYFWSVEDCRNTLLSLLLHRKPFDDVISEKEDEFEKRVKKEFEGKITDLCDRIPVEWNSEFRDLLIDPVEWKKLLCDFNEEIGIQLERVSFKTKILNEQNDLRFRKKEMLEAEEKRKDDLIKLKAEENHTETRIKTLLKQIDKSMNMVMTLLEDEVKNKKRIKYMENKITVHEGQVEDRTKDLSNLKMEIGKLEAGGLDVEAVKKLEEDIKDRRPENYNRNVSQDFKDNEARKDVIREYFVQQLDVLAVRGMSEFSVKLVISLKKNFEPGAVLGRLVNVTDRFYTPTFYNWGFVHSNVNIANVGVHWGDNALVNLSDRSWGKGYEELIAIDCKCPLIVNYHTVFQRLTALAEEIVRVNVNYDYCQYKIAKKDGSINCQEFTNRLLKTLDYTPFFPPVQIYLDKLRNRLSKMEKHDSYNLRFLTISDSFRAVYKKVWKDEDEQQQEQQESESESEEEEEGKKKKKKKKKFAFSLRPDKKKGRVYFNKHEDVDRFYNACLKVDDSLDVKFPGEYALLKGFDRAFWMKPPLGGDGGKLDCPFVHGHQRKLEYKDLMRKTAKEDEDDEIEKLLLQPKMEDDFIEEKEELEEEEGEDDDDDDREEDIKLKILEDEEED